MKSLLLYTLILKLLRVPTGVQDDEPTSYKIALQAIQTLPNHWGVLRLFSTYNIVISSII